MSGRQIRKKRHRVQRAYVLATLGLLAGMMLAPADLAFAASDKTDDLIAGLGAQGELLDNTELADIRGRGASPAGIAIATELAVILWDEGPKGAAPPASAHLSDSHSLHTSNVAVPRAAP